jgi:hypothetical protein
MKIAVQGSNTFSDYAIFMRAMRTALYSMDKNDKEVILYAVGPIRVNQMAQEFSNVSEDGFRARGRKISCRRMPQSWLESNMSDINYFAFFKKPGERVSPLVKLADELKVDAQIYEYE